MKFKNRIVAVAAAVVMGMSLAACGSEPASNANDSNAAGVSADSGDNDANSVALSEDEYTEKIESLFSTFETNLTDAVTGWQTAVMNGDTETALASVEELRKEVDKLIEFAEINPPKEFEQAHSEIAEVFVSMNNSITPMFDIMTKVSNGEQPTEEELANLQNAMTEINEDVTSLTSITQKYAGLFDN